MKKMIKFLAATFAVLLFVAFALPARNVVGSDVRDCDNNAVIKCGALTTSELVSRINSGGLGPNQSPGELKTLFNHYGAYTSDFNSENMKNGKVTNGGLVYVGDKVVYRDAKSMGRHYISGSTKISWVDYPLYLRPTSVSFLSSSIDAFVYMNPDGTMAYAVLKSCGNIVPGNGVKYRLNVVKWNDLNGDAHKQANEPYLGGIPFKITGPDYEKTLTTPSNGVITTVVKRGTYTIRELPPTGWKPTTPHIRTINVYGDEKIWFGNQKPTVTPLPKPKYKLTIWKYLDLNRDKTRQTSEAFLSGWTFDVKGPNNYFRTVITGSNGGVTISEMDPGTYTVTERIQNGWETTTGIAQSTQIVNSGRILYFGNAYIVQPQFIQLHVYKYNDLNSNRIQDEGEDNLEGWKFRVSGGSLKEPIEIVTDVNGHAPVTGLRPGTYTVTEILRDGWENTTGLSISRNVTIDASTQTFVFGNKQKVTPPVTPPSGGGEIVTTTLPTSGPLDMAIPGFISLSASGGILSWIRSRKLLAKASRKL